MSSESARTESSGNDATLLTYAAAPGLPAAKDFRVAINGEDVFVCNSGQGAWVNFSCGGVVTIAVTPAKDFQRVDVRPLSRSIAHQVDGRTITFQLDRPGHVVVEIDGDIKRPLFIFASPLETDVPSPDDAGVRYIAAGEAYEGERIELASNETLYIAGGAVVRAAVLAEGATNVRIAGRGVLDATNLERQHFIRLTECEGVRIEGVVLFNGPGWNCVPWSCRDVHIDNIKIVAWRGACDGIDVVSCQNVLIENCFIRNEDDCIALKAHGRNVEDVTVRSCVLWNGMPGNALEIGFDLEAQAVRNVAMEDCDVIRVEEGGVLTIHNGDTTVVEDVRFDSIRVEDVRDMFIDLRVGMSVWSADCPEEYRPRFDDADYTWTGSWLGPADDELDACAAGRGHIRNVTFRDITVHGQHVPPSYILSYDTAHAVENVTIAGLQIAGRHITDLAGGNINLTADDWYATQTDPTAIRFAAD